VIRPILGLLVCILLAVVIVLVPGRRVQAGSDAAKPAFSLASAVDDSDDATSELMARYCRKKGGEVDVREPYFNTNDDNQANWLRLSGKRRFCKFTSPVDGSRIHLWLNTMYTQEPSLAALAYYAKIPLGTGCNGNPGSCYCSQLGGSDLFGGINANGGGWVQKSDPLDTVLEACIFPDMSTIDSWGLAYHSVGIVRGRNLKNVLRYPDPYTK
jgi:putative hemolysin